MTTRPSLDDSVALITGASAGIGRETARLLACEGADIAIAARREGLLEDLATDLEGEHGVEVLPVPTDVSEKNQVEQLVDRTIERFDRLDVVVANAAIGANTNITFDEMPEDQFRDVLDVNASGMFFTAQSVVPHLRDSNGVMVFVGSFAGKFPRPHAPVYAATKWWTRGFALSLAGQLGPEDVGISIVNPSEVRTEFGKEHRDQMNKDKYEPGSVTEPEDIAEAIVFAASQESPNAGTELDLFRRDKFEGF